MIPENIKVSKGALITRNMLDESLDNQIRYKSEKITMADLDALVVAGINKFPSSVPNLYDDEELRNRVATIESGRLPSGNIFVKGIDKVTVPMLDYNTKTAYEHTLKVPGLLTDKADKTYVDSTFRRKDTPIKDTDLDPLLKKAIDTVVSHDATMNSYYASYAAIRNDVDNVTERVVNMEKNKVDITTLNNYRRKTDVINTTDLPSSAQNAITRLDQIERALPSYLKAVDAENTYRRKDAQIKYSDLDSSITTKLDHGEAAYVGGGAVVDTAINGSGGLIDKVKAYMISAFGNPTAVGSGITGINSSLASSAASYCGTSVSSMTFSGYCNYLYNRITSIASTMNSIAANINTMNTNMNNISSRITTLNTKIGP